MNIYKVKYWAQFGSNESSAARTYEEFAVNEGDAVEAGAAFKKEYRERQEEIRKRMAPTPAKGPENTLDDKDEFGSSRRLIALAITDIKFIGRTGDPD